MVKHTILRKEIEDIKKKPVMDRTQKEHLKLIKVFGGVRNYLLSMGQFKEDSKLVRCPDVFIERAAQCTQEGIRAICGTDEEYSAYVEKFMKDKAKVGGK